MSKKETGSRFLKQTRMYYVRKKPTEPFFVDAGYIERSLNVLEKNISQTSDSRTKIFGI